MRPKAVEPQPVGPPLPPIIREVDMADKLDRGWRLVQHDGDKDRSCWWVVHGQRVHGYVQRYINSTGRRTGWEAFTRTSHGGYRHLDSTTAASNQRWPDGLGEINTFLWRTRDLAAWGVAQRPDRPAAPANSP